MGDELRGPESFLNLLIESIPEAILVKDVHDRRFTLINHAAEELLGMSRADVFGKTAEEVYPVEYAELVRAEDDELLRSGELLVDDHVIELRGKGTSGGHDQPEEY